MRNRPWIKACLYTLALLVPGSFAIFAVVWLVRMCMNLREKVTAT